MKVTQRGKRSTVAKGCMRMLKPGGSAFNLHMDSKKCVINMALPQIIGRADIRKHNYRNKNKSLISFSFLWTKGTEILTCKSIYGFPVTYPKPSSIKITS